MGKELTTGDGNVVPNPYEDEVKKHLPRSGDIYVERNPSRNGFHVLRLKERSGEEGSYRWTYENLVGEYYSKTIGEDSLRNYYRPLLNGFEEILSLAEKTVEGNADEVAALIGAGENKKQETSSEELMATESPEHIKAMLDSSQRLQNKLEEIRLMTDILIEAKKAELEAKLREMDKYLSVVNEKVSALVKVISVLNIYTGRTVDLHLINEGNAASPEEPLSLRQRIIFMDEELCVHLDHEADYTDVPAFFEWLKEPANRDIVIPEPRSIVTLKPKRFGMDYRSGDSLYDRLRNEWNRHTYILLRNGDNLWWAESDDLEVWDWAFPHENFEEAFQESLRKDRHFVDSRIKEHDAVKFRITKYMTFIQGLIDQRPDIIGTVSVRPNLLKLTGIRLVRDDENLIGTGRKPWEEFLKEKNASIRRGTRIVYVAGKYWNGESYYGKCADSGGFVKYYTYAYSRPAPPTTGLYSADVVETVVRHENHKPVREPYPKLVIKYLPGDEVFDKSDWEYRERKNRVSWWFDMKYVINYDAVTLDELTGYLEDRTIRSEFASMLPLLKRVLVYKKKEMQEEDLFKRLLVSDVRKETGSEPSPEAVDSAVAWWKEKVIFSRPLNSDDTKAWKMIRARVLRQDD
ncbi:MAG: hypothetical protein IJ904_07700 [Candidatus Methanomethylophilaceae archaeon]|nr:hypothetical protein [Candidatus Methanomethylophilaceae archaeon]